MLIDNILLYKKCPKYRLTLCKPNKEPIQVLEEAYEKIFTPNVVETDELVFSIPFKVANQINPNWELIKGNYLIYLEQVLEEDDTVLLEQYFVIKNIINSSEDKEEKRVHCYSYEHLLTKKLIHSFKGVKKLYRTPAEIAAYVPDEMYPTLDDFLYSGILNYIISLVPSWSVGTVDEEINNKFRDLEIDAQSVLDFLLNKVQSTYDCVFEFDTINNEINVKKFSSIGLNKGLFISDKNYIKSLEQEINFDEVVTRLNLYGKDNMSIHSVNVTGQSYIDNLSFFRNTDYMSQSLLDALDIYDNLLESKQTEFSTLLGDLDTYTSQLATKQDELDILETELIVLEDTRDALIEQGANLNDINSQITAKESEITNKQSEINSIIDDIDTTNSSISVLRSDIAIENNFTSEQIKELDTFIFEKDYRDIAYINPQELYEDGLEIMQKINQPPIDININIVDFLNIVECQHDWNKLKLGDIVSIQQLKYNINIELRIIGFSHDIDNNELTLRLSNKSSLNDPDMQLAELIENAISTTTTLDINRFKYGRYDDSGERSALLDYISSELDLAAQKAVAGKNQNIEIGRKGIRLASTTDNGQECRLLNNLIVFTDDHWQTAKIALDPTKGVIAENVYGKLGAFCTVTADQIVVGDQGETIPGEVLGDDVVKQNQSYNSVYINSEDGVKAVHSPTGEYTQLSANGLERYVPLPIYQETPTGVPNFEGFEDGVLPDDWESRGVSIISSDKRSGTYCMQIPHATNRYARTVQWITKDTTFSFWYKSLARTRFFIDTTMYTLQQQATWTQFTAQISKGFHVFQWQDYRQGSSSSYDYAIRVDDITFEQNPVELTFVGYDTEGYNYAYRTYVGTGATCGRYEYQYENLIADVWVQLPEDFKGKDFKVTLSLQENDDSLGWGSIRKIKLSVLEIDNNKPAFKVRGRITYIEPDNNRNVSGVVFMYIASY